MPDNSYNTLPYACRPIRWTHPDNLACKATLHGLVPAEMQGCRVMEIGCGNGMNLLSLAQILPRAQFIGIDNAGSQIEQGRNIAAEIACPNIELQALSVTELRDQFGKFDYIICHGLYSWVPREIAGQILPVIKNCLAVNGIAYVSYNTYPGWHSRSIVREVLRRQTDASASPSLRVQQARQYLDFLVANAPQSDSVYLPLLKREQAILARSPDAYLFHEHLAEVNEPIFFHQFADRVVDSGLQYLCEANFSPAEAMFSDECRQRLKKQSTSRVEYEQQVDYLTGETFRRSLLCHADITPMPEPSSAALSSMHLRSGARPDQGLDAIRGLMPVTFRGSRGESVTASHPLLKACLSALAAAWPQWLTLSELQRRGHNILDNSSQATTNAQESDQLAHALLKCHRTGIVEVQMLSPQVVVTIGQRPRVSPLARWQTAQGEPVSNLMHEIVDLDGFDRHLVGLLDGQRDLAALEALLIEHTLNHLDDRSSAGDTIPNAIQHSLARSLKKLAQLNVLLP